MQEETAGVKHLADLRAAGLTHVHLLPSYDFGSVPEREEDQQTPQVWVIAHPSGLRGFRFQGPLTQCGAAVRCCLQIDLRIALHTHTRRHFNRNHNVHVV